MRRAIVAALVSVLLVAMTGVRWMQHGSPHWPERGAHREQAILEAFSPQGPTTIRVTGLTHAALATLHRDPTRLQLRLIDDSTHQPATAPIAGRVWLDDADAHFTTVFPLVEGGAYLVTLAVDVTPPAVAPLSVGASVATPMIVMVPAGRHAAPEVEAAFPTTDTVPENLLKFYLRFTTPMRRGYAATHVALVDERGHVVRAFLRSDSELWDAGDRMLTLFFDPARVKTGLRAHVKLGRALRAGRHYQLLILPGWPSANGVPLVAPFRKPFTVGAEDRIRVDERSWAISLPCAGSEAPLLLNFHEPVDYLLAQTALVVVDKRGASVPGTQALLDKERQWRFTPDGPWRPGAYTIAIDPALEDLAGNNLIESFDRPLAERPRNAEAISLDFTVPPQFAGAPSRRMSASVAAPSSDEQEAHAPRTPRHRAAIEREWIHCHDSDSGRPGVTLR